MLPGVPRYYHSSREEHEDNQSMPTTKPHTQTQTRTPYKSYNKKNISLPSTTQRHLAQNCGTCTCRTRAPPLLLCAHHHPDTTPGATALAQLSPRVSPSLPSFTPPHDNNTITMIIIMRHLLESAIIEGSHYCCAVLNHYTNWLLLSHYYCSLIVS